MVLLTLRYRTLQNVHFISKVTWLRSHFMKPRFSSCVRQINMFCEWEIMSRLTLSMICVCQLSGSAWRMFLADDTVKMLEHRHYARLVVGWLAYIQRVRHLSKLYSYRDHSTPCHIIYPEPIVRSTSREVGVGSWPTLVWWSWWLLPRDDILLCFPCHFLCVTKHTNVWPDMN